MNSTKLRLVLSLVAMVVSLSINATIDSGTCGDNATWRLEDDGTLYIEGSGKMDSYDNRYKDSVSPFIFYSNSIKKVQISNGITSIGAYAFDNCEYLTSVTIPKSITSIGGNAFSKCRGLTSVHISDISAWCNINFSNVTSNPIGGYAHKLYLNGEVVKDLIIPNSVTTIKDYCFEECTTLTSVTIPNSVTSISKFAFDDCRNLTSVTIGNSVSNIGRLAFDGCELRYVFQHNTVPQQISQDAFNDKHYTHANLYVPAGSWSEYAYTQFDWYKFIHINEFSSDLSTVSEAKTYALLSVNDSKCIGYDVINDEITSVECLDENNVNTTWMFKELNGKKYLYNLGAKKFAYIENGGMSLTSNATNIDASDGEYAIEVAGTGEYYFIENMQISAYKYIDNIITAINESKHNGSNIEQICATDGTQLMQTRKGVNIIKYSDGKVKKILCR